MAQQRKWRTWMFKRSYRIVKSTWSMNFALTSRTYSLRMRWSRLVRTQRLSRMKTMDSVKIRWHNIWWTACRALAGQIRSRGRFESNQSTTSPNQIKMRFKTTKSKPKISTSSLSAEISCINLSGSFQWSILSKCEQTARSFAMRLWSRLN